MLGDDEIPSQCECEQDKGALKQETMQYEIIERVTLLTVTYINADSLEMAIGIARDQGAIEYDKLIECENHEIVCAREIGKGT